VTSSTFARAAGGMTFAMSIFLADLGAAAPAVGLLDTDADLAISRTEAAEARAALLRRIDRDGDGRITAFEADAAVQAIVDRANLISSILAIRMRALDEDGDTVVTAEELMAGPFAFDILDRDGDDLLDADEIAPFRLLSPASR